MNVRRARRFELVLLGLLPVLSAGCKISPGLKGADFLDEEAAHLLVWNLPEVQRAAAHVRTASRGNARPITMTESRPTAENPRAPWGIYFGEDHVDHVARWAAFEVDGVTRVIRAWSWSRDAYVSLEEWRREEGSTWSESKTSANPVR